MPNRLAGETSPYLLQHAHNPVDWFPWGPDALARAKLLDRPIFLSIGYAACHWCHVMERESFENEATADFLNGRFVSIKVDREERPDLDQVYMGAVQAMTGGGGWPMTVFLTPDGRPFYGGTYFPDEPRHGMPSFRQVLEGVDRAFREQRAEVEQAGARLVTALIDQARVPAATGPIPAGILDAAVTQLAAQFDAPNGGWGQAPKFPQAMTISFLLRRYSATGDEEALAMARRSLDRMADGGIRDQLGGGFHRYSTDAVWLAPHFEQMLYDNGQLARAYLHAWSVTGDLRYRDVAISVLDYLLRELRTDDGAFAASQDADTEGVEGATFAWTAAEVADVAGADGPLFAAAYDVTEQGNWEGHTILRRLRSPEELGARFEIAPQEVEERLARVRTRLLEVRTARPQPARDDKVLASWNGLALGAFGDAARYLRTDPDPAVRGRATVYRDAAVRAAAAVLGGLFDEETARLGRSWKDGRATGSGVLEDYIHLADGLLAVYEATFDERWFTTARRLMDVVLARFADPAGGFFDTADDHERLVARPKDIQDNALPSGGAMASMVLLRLAAWTGQDRYRAAAATAIAPVAAHVARHPTAFAQWASSIDLFLAAPLEIAIVGDPNDSATIALRDVVDALPQGSHVVALAAYPAAADPTTSAIELLADRVAIDGKPTAYVCRAFACRLPVTDPDALRSQLSGDK
ncbi:MAG: thioredoxin domain-containing protein [Chloroflexota bacterium]